MAGTCIAVVDICAVRATLLTSAGAPVPGAQSSYVTHAQQSLEITFENESGRDETLISGCNELIATIQDEDKLKGVSLALVTTELEAYLNHLLLGDDVVMSGGDAIGGRSLAVGTSPDPTCFEAWCKAWRGGSQIVDPFTDPAETWVRLVFPFGRWARGNTNHQINAATFPINGKIRENESLTINGPHDDFPAEIAATGGCPRLFNWFYDDALPDATCDWVAVTGVAS